MGFQETKLNVVSDQIINQLFGFQDVGFTFSLSINSVGGILCCWNSTVFAESSRVCNLRFVVIKGSWTVGDGHQGLICIYAPKITLIDHFSLNRLSLLSSIEITTILSYLGISILCFEDKNGGGEWLWFCL